MKGPGTSKLDWRYFEHNKVERNELQILKNLRKGTGTKITHYFWSNCSIFQSFLFQCLYANFCVSGVHFYQLYCVQSTSSPILKSLVPWGHLVGGYLSLCYLNMQHIYSQANNTMVWWLFCNRIKILNVFKKYLFELLNFERTSHSKVSCQILHI